MIDNPVDLDIIRQIVAHYDKHPSNGTVPERLARELLQRREAEQHDWKSAGHPAGDDTVCTRCGADVDSPEDARPCPGGDVDREHHANVARSRRRWIDAATACLGPAWSGTPDDLRKVLAVLCRCAHCGSVHHATKSVISHQVPGMVEHAETTIEWEPSECRVCGARPDPSGMISHGKGCYVVDDNGGGYSYAERVEKSG